MNAKPDYSHLRGWTPISFSAEPEPGLVWADLRAYRFDRPFFHRTLKQWREDGHGQTERTGLDGLNALDSSPSLDPSLIIFHAARCGSTLLTRLMGAIEGTVALSEPSILGHVLDYSIGRPADCTVQEILRQTIRALGRVRFGDERLFVLKLSSTLTRFLPLFRRVYPDVPMVWLQRRPDEIVESELRAPGAWLGAKGKSDREVQQLAVHQHAVVFLAAKTHVDDNMLVLDYRDLPDAAWTKVAPFIGIAPSENDLLRMHDVVRYDAHSDKPFKARALSPLPNWVQTIVAQTLDPLYEALDRRRSRPAA
ncbi:MAG: hypothetical protein WAM62_12180 [Pseudolabrys sp.]